MKTVDFTKKVVCSDETIKVVQVIPVKWLNPLFEHSLIVENSNGYQQTIAVDNLGKPSKNDQDFYLKVTFLNPEPKVISTTYRNVYHNGFIGKSWPTREDAEKKSDSDRSGILETLKFDDGASKVKFIEV